MHLHISRLFLRSLGLLVVGLMAFASPAGAEPPQKTEPSYALIFGTVWDAQLHPAYGVPIKIRRDDQKKAKWDLVSNHRGEFAQRVPAGTADYVVWADLKPPKGKKDWQRTETKVHIENDERVDISLHLTE
jgi:hypothetical protein